LGLFRWLKLQAAESLMAKFGCERERSIVFERSGI
jgi:hypothetical protein